MNAGALAVHRDLCSNRNATYYISPAGNDSDSGTSVRAPLRTIQKAVDVARPGEVIQIEPGRYGPVSIWMKYGTPGNHYTLMGDENYPREKTIIGGRIWIRGAFWDICHLRQTGNKYGPGLGLRFSDHVAADDVEIDHNANSGYFAMGPGSYLSLSHSLVHDNSLANLHGAQAQQGAWNNGVQLLDVSNSAVMNNSVEDNWGEGIDVMSRDIGVAANNRVVANTVHNAFSVGLYNDNAPGTLWKGNFVYADSAAFNRDGIPMQGMSVADERGKGPGSLGVQFADNVVYGTSNGFRYGNYGRHLGMRDVRVIGNTIVGSTGFGIKIDYAAGTSGNLIANNIVSSRTGYAASVPPAAGVRGTHNLWSGNSHGMLLGDGDVVADLQFVGGPYDTPLSYELRPGSPAAGKGLQLSDWSTDFTGKRRPPLTPSIGAFEPAP